MSANLARLLLTGVLAVLPGCLFVGDINQRPAVSFYETHATGALGTAISLTAYLSDDQRGAALSLTLRDGDGALVTLPSCTARLTQQPVSDSETYITIVLWKPGTYTLSALPTDAFGAHGSTASLQVTVTDSSPAFQSQAGPRASDPVQSCGANYIASNPIRIVLDSPAVNPDASAEQPDAKCGSLAKPITYHWRIESQPTMHGSLTALVNGTCAAGAQVTELDAGLGVCLVPDPAIGAIGASSYVVSVIATDGVKGTEKASLQLPVIGESPACLNGVYPGAGTYVLATSETSIFQAIGVDDVDAAGALLYRWTLKRPSDAGYTIIVDYALGSDGGGRLSFDPSLYQLAVGDTVSLQVEVEQPDSDGSTCATGDDPCQVQSCAASASTCPRRATWTLEMR